MKRNSCVIQIWHEKFTCFSTMKWKQIMTVKLE